MNLPTQHITIAWKASWMMMIRIKLILAISKRKMELPNANYENMSTPVPIVAKVGLGDAISNSLIPIHAEYEEELI